MRTAVKVIVIGAGYAGLLAANRLAARGRRVQLVSPMDGYVDRIRLHEYAAGRRAAPARPLRTVVRDGVEVVTGWVEQVGAGAVALADGRVLGAPQVLVTTGSCDRAERPGALSVGSLARAARTRMVLRELPPGARVQVLGGGLTGIETATEIAEALPHLRIQLMDRREPGSSLPDRARDHLRAACARLRIEVTTSAGTPPGGIPDRLQGLRTGDVVIDCTGFAPTLLASRSGLPCDDSGALSVDATLAVPGHPGLWGAGDAVAVDGWAARRMGCAVAMPMGAQAADAIEATLRGRAAADFSLSYTFRCISLGGQDGLIVWTDADDEPTGRVWTGRRAAVIKEAVCAMACAAPVRGASLYRWRQAA